MTDRTHPDSGRIITGGDLLLQHDAETALMYEELRAAIDDGHESMTHADALAEIAAIRAENEQLRAQLDSIGAGGVSGPLMGRASLAANAGSEPAAYVQNPAEIEHVAGDVSKNGPESNMAQQPAPSAAAALHPKTADLVQRFAAALADKLAAAEKKYGYSDGWASPDWMDECRLYLREHLFKGDPRDVAAYCAFLWHHGESTALPSEVVEDRVKEFEQLFPAPKPSPTPQADSQPAPELDLAVMQLAESVGLIGPASRVHDLHAAIQRFHDLICVNATIKAAVMAADAIRGAATSARDYPPLPMQFACSGVFPVYSADQMRAYVDADRAARAPADSVTAPAGGAVDGWKLAPEEPTLHMGWAYLDAARESDPLRTHTFNHAGYRAMLAAAPTPPAQAQAGAVPLTESEMGEGWRKFQETLDDRIAADPAGVRNMGREHWLSWAHWKAACNFALGIKGGQHG